MTIFRVIFNKSSLRRLLLRVVKQKGEWKNNDELCESRLDQTEKTFIEVSSERIIYLPKN